MIYQKQIVIQMSNKCQTIVIQMSDNCHTNVRQSFFKKKLTLHPLCD
jgi:hypothetical protein